MRSNMVNGIKEKYEIRIDSPIGLNLLTSDVNNYIRDNIWSEVDGCVADFTIKHKVVPTIIRVPGAIQEHYKRYLMKATKKNYIPDSRVAHGGVPIETSCKVHGTKVVLEFWNEVPDPEPVEEEEDE